MKEVPRVEWARRLVDDQLARLSELRNASPRDPGFKQWRQSTLTVIQRIWPGDLGRCERFRRIPFSANSPKVTRIQIREHFERGCAEASAFLKILTLELEAQGVIKPGVGAAPPKPATLPEDFLTALEPGSPAFDPRDMFEPSPLDRIEAASAAPPPAEEAPTEMAPPSTPAPDRGAAPAAPGRAEPRAEPARRPKPVAQPPQRPEPARASETPMPPPGSEPQAAAPTRPKPAASLPPPPPTPRAEVPPIRSPRRHDRQALKDMLGFVDEPPQRAAPASPPAGSQRPMSPPPSEAPPPAAEPRPIPANEAADQEPTFTPPLPPPAFVEEEDEQVAEMEDLELQAEEDEYEEDEPQDEPQYESNRSAAPGDLAIEFLKRWPAPRSETAAPASRPSTETRTPEPVQQRAPEPATMRMPEPVAMRAEPLERPVAQATPRAPEPAAMPAPAPVETGTPTAAALVALAGEVDRLGVPDGQRAAARAALIDLARQLDEEIASFDSIREILWVVADYPALARRAIPLLISFLDLE